jgi:hypothetical protein
MGSHGARRFKHVPTPGNIKDLDVRLSRIEGLTARLATMTPTEAQILDLQDDVTDLKDEKRALEATVARLKNWKVRTVVRLSRVCFSDRRGLGSRTWSLHATGDVLCVQDVCSFSWHWSLLLFAVEERAQHGRHIFDRTSCTTGFDFDGVLSRSKAK